jgi:SAM-dependent methyltransferase
MLTVLAVGCGRRTGVDDYKIEAHAADGAVVPAEVKLITLDQNAQVKPTLVCTLGYERIPLREDSVDLIVAEHVLEHIGTPGKTGCWFQMWGEFYRVLKPGGRVQFTCPYYSSVWAWADPTHTRAISEQTFLYLNQDAYRVGGSIPDFRPEFDFVLLEWGTSADEANPGVKAREGDKTYMHGTLAARKPLRPYWEQAT